MSRGVVKIMGVTLGVAGSERRHGGGCGAAMKGSPWTGWVVF